MSETGPKTSNRLNWKYTFEKIITALGSTTVLAIKTTATSLCSVFGPLLVHFSSLFLHSVSCSWFSLGTRPLGNSCNIFISRKKLKFRGQLNVMLLVRFFFEFLFWVYIILGVFYLCLTVSIALFALTSFHFYLISTGQTSIERLQKKTLKESPISYNLGVYKNWKRFFNAKNFTGRVVKFSLITWNI